MKLTEDIKAKIIEEYNDFRAIIYAGRTLEERKTLDQFFTPPTLTIKMIEEMDCESLEDQVILDPTCGSGNLLVACLIAGADYDNLYGNDYDEQVVKLCRKRLIDYCKYHDIPSKTKTLYCSLKYHIHRGNAMQHRCVSDFCEKYIKGYDCTYIDDPKYAQDERDNKSPKKNPNGFTWEEENINAVVRRKIATETHMIETLESEGLECVSIDFTTEE